MQNIELALSDDDILTLTIDLKQEHGLSNRERSVRIACSEGNVDVWKNGQPHEKKIKINVNIFRQLTDEEKQQLGIESRGGR